MRLTAPSSHIALLVFSGTVLKDTPPERPDLEAVVEHLKQPLEFRYHH